MLTKEKVKNSSTSIIKTNSLGFQGESLKTLNLEKKPINFSNEFIDQLSNTIANLQIKVKDKTINVISKITGENSELETETNNDEVTLQINKRYKRQQLITYSSPLKSCNDVSMTSNSKY